MLAALGSSWGKGLTALHTARLGNTEPVGCSHNRVTAPSSYAKSPQIPEDEAGVAYKSGSSSEGTGREGLADKTEAGPWPSGRPNGLPRSGPQGLEDALCTVRATFPPLLTPYPLGGFF